MGWTTAKKRLVVGLGVGVIVLVSALVATGSSGDRDRLIIGGSPADDDEYPFAVVMELDGKLCGGSLIDAEWVLTAAHCVYTDAGDTIDPAKVSLTVGRTRRNETSLGHTRGADQIVAHPDYNDVVTSNDVALVHLSEPIDAIQPVKVVAASEQSLWEPEDKAVVIGWGLTRPREEGGKTSNALLELDVNVISDEVMASPDVYGPRFAKAHMLGAGYLEGGRDSCNGDSGGPLLAESGGEFRVIGVVSWGDGCATENRPGIYTRIGETALRDFIVRTMATSNSSGTPRRPRGRG